LSIFTQNLVNMLLARWYPSFGNGISAEEHQAGWTAVPEGHADSGWEFIRLSLRLPNEHRVGQFLHTLPSLSDSRAHPVSSWQKMLSPWQPAALFTILSLLWSRY